MAQRLIQAYRQTPWRKQTQRIGIFLLVLLLIGLVAGVYLSVTAQAAEAGIRIRMSVANQNAAQLVIADLNNQLARLTSEATMKQRAAELGFVPATSEQIDYLVVPGYTEKEFSLAPSNADVPVQMPILKTVYTESLWEWLMRGVLQPQSSEGASK